MQRLILWETGNTRKNVREVCTNVTLEILTAMSISWCSAACGPVVLNMDIEELASLPGQIPEHQSLMWEQTA
jgi:hypothetical protein